MRKREKKEEKGEKKNENLIGPLLCNYATSYAYWVFINVLWVDNRIGLPFWSYSNSNSNHLDIIRFLLEEKVLHEGLEGYTEYTEKVKYRLIPKIW